MGSELPLRPIRWLNPNKKIRRLKTADFLLQVEQFLNGFGEGFCHQQKAEVCRVTAIDGGVAHCESVLADRRKDLASVDQPHQLIAAAQGVFVGLADLAKTRVVIGGIGGGAHRVGAAGDDDRQIGIFLAHGEEELLVGGGEMGGVGRVVIIVHKEQAHRLGGDIVRHHLFTASATRPAEIAKIAVEAA